MKKIINIPVVILTIVGSIMFYLSINSQATKLQENQRVIDSLVNENLSLSIDNGRYEIMLNRLREADSTFVDTTIGSIE